MLREKCTPGQEVAGIHVKPCFCLGRKQTAAEWILSAGKGRKGQVCLKGARRGGPARGQRPSEELNAGCHRHVRHWPQLHRHHLFTGLKQSAEYRPQHWNKVENGFYLHLTFIRAGWKQRKHSSLSSTLIFFLFIRVYFERVKQFLCVIEYLCSQRAEGFYLISMI